MMRTATASGRWIAGHAPVSRLLAFVGVAWPLIVGTPSWANGEENLQRCHAAYKSGAYDLAKGLCARAAKDQSLPAESRALAHLYRAVSSCACEEALPDYDAAVALAPKMGAAYLSRAIAYHDLKRYDEALRDLTTAAKFEPREPAVYSWRGIVLLALDRPTEALADFERLSVMTPNASDVWRLKGNVEMQLGRLDRAIRDFDHSLRLDSRNGATFGSRAIAHAEMGDLKTARSDVDAAVRLVPNEPRHVLDRGRIALLAGDPDKAIPDMVQGMLRLPEGQLRHYAAIWLSMAILRSGRELEFMPTVLQIVSPADKTGWPASTAWLYLAALSKARKQWDMGDGAEYMELARRAAVQPNAHAGEDRVCEFGFFMGMYHVLHKDPARGEGLLRQAAERRVHSWCHIGAKIEHVRLLQRQTKGAVR